MVGYTIAINKLQHVTIGIKEHLQIDVVKELHSCINKAWLCFFCF